MPKIKVEIRCSGQGSKYDRTVEVTRDDIEQLATKKLRETDASVTMHPIDVSFVF